MKKYNAFWQRLPRPLRTAVQILACTLCLIVIYIAGGSPAMTPEMQYGRLEKSHLIGPSAILGTEAVSEDSSEKIIIAESESDVMLYRYHEGAEIPSTDLVCRQKTGSLTVLAAGGQNPYFSTSRPITLPVILFDDYPNATRAELDIVLTGDFIEDKYNPNLRFEKQYTLESVRTNAGYFRFTIFYAENGDQRIPPLLEMLADISSGRCFGSYLGVSIPVSVRLYGEGNNLICAQQLYIRTVKADAQQP